MSKQFIDIIDLSFSVNDLAFKQAVVKLLWTINHWELGKKLLAAITQKAGGVFTNKLRIKKAPNVYNYRELLGGCPGDDADLILDLSYFANNSIEPTQAYVMACKKEYVYLFHELVHFYHDLSGDFKAKGDLHEECRTVGLYEYQNEEFSENAFRKQIKLDRRPCYVWQIRLSAGLYQQEKAKRAALGLPEQSTLRRDSKECKFAAAAAGKS